ncbi:metaxin-1 isoform 2 [Rattus norvegicus]|uniref:Metaxin-1 n=1 Tax=Rattus norvegicus TaxID=10116 RepID=B0BN02_RAT|nr:metaxin-1 isoform 2 [Rattus norvegicus]AAI58633.1 Mtx1 protein [Rattus norvegicus]|eukprot:NP_001094137.1 metaxin-1 [Rattus norvegicus]
MRLGGPPRNVRSGQRFERSRCSRGHVQFGKSPQRPLSRTRCPSSKPCLSPAVRGYARQRHRESPKRAWTAALLPYGGRLRTSPRRSSEGQCSTSSSAAASPAARSHASLDLKLRVATQAETRGCSSWREKADAYERVLPGQRMCKMAAPMELFCWSGGWGLPSVDLDSLAVLTYTRFTCAPLKVHKISNPWQSPSGTLPALRTSSGKVITEPHKIITHLRKEIHTFWIDAKNYVEVTRKWYAEAMPFPLNFFLPGRMQRRHMERLQLLCGEHRLESEEELEKELYQEARECLTLLSHRLGSRKFFFGDAPASLDAFVFSHLVLLLQAKLPSGKLQAHLRGLQNLCVYCTHILNLYFPRDATDVPPPPCQTPAGPETEEEPYRRRTQILSVLAGLAAMVGYALLSGIVSIQRASPARAPCTQALDLAEEDEED